MKRIYLKPKAIYVLTGVLLGTQLMVGCNVQPNGKSKDGTDMSSTQEATFLNYVNQTNAEVPAQDQATDAAAGATYLKSDDEKLKEDRIDPTHSLTAPAP